ncbi:RNA-directed DNA polymerase, eukaryota, partial [Tanacetum coccineum]
WQETKMSHMDLVTVRMVWGNSRFDFASSSARGVWKIGNLRMQFITVYAPQYANAKILLWYRLQILISRFNGESIIIGDFNVVRVPEERMGSEFNINMAESFNNFIMENDLVDVSLGGYQFTWVNSLATKMSKIDRFLISGGLLERFPDLAGTILDKGVPDHRPILLKEAKADYGPIPFRFFHSWLDCDGFDELVVNSWSMPCVGDSNPIVVISKKLKRLKNIIKTWNSDRRKNEQEVKHGLLQKIKDVESRTEIGNASTDELEARRGYVKQLGEINRREGIDLAQKARVKWNVDGDENSKYFHGLVNQKRRQIAIRGIMVDVAWEKNPERVKNEFKSYFSEKFSPFVRSRPRMEFEFSRGLSTEQSAELEVVFSKVEIKESRVIKDYRPISLIGSFYKIVGKLLANRIASVVEYLISTEQSAFVKGRQIMDGPMILNEILNWCKKEKKKKLIFKVDFEKAYGFVCWDYLQDVMFKMGFGRKWCAWIRGCLESSVTSILVNGSPTDEFKIRRGLRQGDPLSPFLFILAMEGLHMLISCAIHSS